MDGAWAVILAGGCGVRLWPWSRRHRPKPVLAVGDATLLAATVARLPVPPARVLVVTGASMADAVRAAAPDLPPGNVLVEPCPRHTAPAVAWGVAEAGRRGAEVVGVFPADHHVADVAAFRSVIEAGLAGVAARGSLGLVAIEPTGPATGYGYLVTRAEGGRERVVRFVEKPDPRGAVELLRAGAAWNAGVFLGAPAAFARAVARHLPATARALDRVAAGDLGAWAHTDAVSFDRGVLERHDDVEAFRGAFGWSDLGTWETVAEALPAAPWGAGLAAEVRATGGGHLVVAPGRRVVLVGVERLLVVDDGEVLAVAHRDDADALAALARALGEEDDAWR